jgi:hypothetical protein
MAFSDDEITNTSASPEAGQTVADANDGTESEATALQIEWVNETYGELTFDAPANWRKKLQDNNGGYFYYATNNDADGFLFVGGRGFTETAPVDFEGKKELMRSLADSEGDEGFVEQEIVRENFEVSGHYAFKSFSVWEGYECLYYYILTDIGVYLIGVDIYETSPDNLTDVLESVVSSITITPLSSGEAPGGNADGNSSSSEWREFLREYEEWVDNYIELMNKYNENPMDMTIMSDYMEAVLELTEWQEKIDSLESDLTGDDLEEYLETILRISAKLSQLVY